MSTKENKSKQASRNHREIAEDQLWNSERMSKISSIISSMAEKQTPEQRLKTEILAIKYKIHMYLDKKDVEKKVQILDFVKLYLKTLEMTQKEFASKIGMEDTNLHKYFTGERKLNTDIVMKLSAFTHTQPELWLSLQNKNDLLEIKKDELEKYKKYDYEKLSDLFTHRKGRDGRKHVSSNRHPPVHA